MICPKCGAIVSDGTSFCVTCGAQMNETQNQAAVPPEQQAAPQQPENQAPQAQSYVYGGNTPNNMPPQGGYYNGGQQTPPAGKPLSGTSYLICSILTLLFCCLPGVIGGIIGIINSTKIDKLWALGDYSGAQDAAKKSKMAIIISASIGALIWALYFVLIIAGVVNSGSYYY